MAYRICKTIEVESGHALSKHPGRCKFPHGHSRIVELILEADELDHNEMVCDFGVIKQALAHFLDKLDHSMCMNTDDRMYETFKEAYGERIIPFEGKDPTTEVISKMIFDHTKEHLDNYKEEEDVKFPLGAEVRLKRVRVWETSTSWAEYAED